MERLRGQGAPPRLVRSTPPVPTVLPPEFPTVIVTETWGCWWRVHRASDGAWWFASSDGSNGRFDLPKPHGTCYVGYDPEAPTQEHLTGESEDHARSQKVINERALSAMPLDRWRGRKIADFTSAAVVHYGAPAKIEDVPRDQARPWGVAAKEGGFAGILYRLSKDRREPKRWGLALFFEAGEHAPPNEQSRNPLPTQLRNELANLIGAYPDDPLAS
jgi:hypothetical protein